MKAKRAKGGRKGASKTPRASSAAKDAPPAQGAATEATELTCPVVGVGSSAGGLDALEGFFGSMAATSGAAFVVVPHLDPTAKSLLVELLARRASMPVERATDGARVLPNRVYVVPPGASIRIERGLLQLGPREDGAEGRFPIDGFLRSLAEDRGHDAVCIILSGTGTDGTLGLKAIQEHGGLTMVQDPPTALHDGMPRSALATGLVDHVLPVAEMSSHLIAYLERTVHFEAVGDGAKPARSVPAMLAKVLHHLKTRTGHDFSHYKRGTVQRRVERRMRILGATDLEDYVRLLRERTEEQDLLFKDLLIGVTYFFRNPEVFAALDELVVRSLVAPERGDRPIRVWVPGCATGEEAYSIAILLAERMEARSRPPRVQIFATDLNPAALDVARAGLYPEGITADLSEERLERFFRYEGGCYRVGRRIREMVVFSTHDLVRDPPFSRLDLLSCRNVLIYMDPALHVRLLALFHHALAPDGALLLGPSEGLGRSDDLFAPLDGKHRIFRRAPGTGRAAGSGAPFPIRADHAVAANAPRLPPSAETTIRATLERTLLDDYTPACVVVDASRHVVHLSGHTGKWLELPSGSVDTSVLRLVRPGLRAALRGAIQRAADTGRATVATSASVRLDGSEPPIDVIVRPFEAPGLDPGALMIVFDDRGPVRAPAVRASTPETTTDAAPVARETLEEELRIARERMQASAESSETALEELRSANEELLSMNEEAQSTNQELEISKEEIQSVNEELETVNAELASRVEELGRANSDLANLLESTDISTIFLGKDLRVQRFTPKATEIFHLIATDVGRPITDLAQRIVFAGLEAEVRRVLRTLVPSLHEVAGNEGIRLLMRISPYRSVDDGVEGAVLTFVDVTDLKRSQESAERARVLAESVLDTVRESLLVLDEDLRVVTANRPFHRTFGSRPGEIGGRSVWGLAEGQLGRSELGAYLTGVVDESADPPELEVSLRSAEGPARSFLVNARRMERPDGAPPVVLVAFDDITERRQGEAEIRELQKMEAIGGLAGGIAHDFGNVLMAVTGYAEQLVARFDPGDVRRAPAEQILKVAEHGSWLIRQLLTLSGRHPSTPQTLDLAAVAESVEQLLEPILGEHIEIRGSHPRGRAWVRADRTHLEQVVMNLMLNARDAMPEGGTLHVVVELSEADPTADGEAVLRIEDTGCGMDAAGQARMFDPFYTTKAAGVGSGLGLSTVYGIVREAGGRIEVRSEPKAGTVVRVLLPLVEAPLVEHGEVGPPPAGATGGSETVLVVEDDAHARGILAYLLEEQGYRALVADTAEQAIERLGRTDERIDVLLTDIVLPGSDGFALARRASELRPELKILYMSGYPEDRRVAKGDPVDEERVLRKPFRSHDLLVRIRNLLQVEDGAAGPRPELEPG